MLKKNLNALRENMAVKFSNEEYGSQIKNWKLPFNHQVSYKHQSRGFVNTYRACEKLGMPFNPGNLNAEIGGHIEIFKHQADLYEFARRLRDAQTLKREAILPTENGGYKLELAINEVVGFSSRLDT